MNHQEKLSRFEELEAGRILGDLDTGESAEWEDLSKELNLASDFSLELAAAAIEIELTTKGEALPDEIAAKLQRNIPKNASSVGDDAVIRPAVWHRFFSPQMGWIAAALMTALFIGSMMIPPDDSPSVVENPPGFSDEQSREKLIAQAGDLFESEFSGLENFDQMSGKVIWSDEQQEGYLTLSNLPANDPEKKQYQLWIVDPSRDEKPVDGGVFNIPADRETATIPIRNPLAVNQPAAFVITLEQPGGVVVSKQEVVVALAKRL